MNIKSIINKKYDPKGYEAFLVTEETSDEVKAYHESFEDYNETELVSLDALSDHLGLSKLYVKDESTRFNLNAFKVLGAAYAVGKALADQLGMDISHLPFEEMKKKVKENLSDVTLVATTDGNHGRGVSWMGKQLGLDVIIYMPAGTTQNRLNHILKLGAKGTITDMNYDDTVRWVAEEAKNHSWLIIQDTAWEGYEDVPVWIMQGYSTMAREVIESLGDTVPSHIFLQAGVGAFAGVMAEVFYSAYKDKMPKIIVVEADSADCYYQSAIEEREVVCSGDLYTIMAGLACGEANPIGSKVLFQLAHSFVSAPDGVAANGMRILGNPLKGDQGVVSGESGAVSIGLIETIMSKPELKDLKEMLKLDSQSVVLTFSTEGDTDETMYRDIIWYGKH